MRDIRYIGLESAARIGQISAGQARAWARDGILVPSVVYNRNPHRHVFVYSPDDVVALRTIALLRREFHIPLNSATVAAGLIQSRTARPWSTLRLYVRDRHVEITAGHSPSDDDIVVEIAPIAEAVEREIAELARRTPENIGKIEQRRGVMGGQPVVKGTRVPVSTVVSLAAAGWDTEQIVRAYPLLVPEDVVGVLHLVEEQQQVA